MQQVEQIRVEFEAWFEDRFDMPKGCLEGFRTIDPVDGEDVYTLLYDAVEGRQYVNEDGSNIATVAWITWKGAHDKINA